MTSHRLADGMGRAPSPTGQLRDSQKHPPTNSTEALEAIAQAAQQAFEGALKQTHSCERCSGQGYHHGFGERGHDPDWCSVCGGSGFSGVSDEEAWKIASKAIHEALASHLRELQEENARLRQDVIAFCAPWAVTYARDHGYPPGHLHPAHYDILARSGGRMVDFFRHEEPADARSDDTD